MKKIFTKKTKVFHMHNSFVSVVPKLFARIVELSSKDKLLWEYRGGDEITVKVIKNGRRNKTAD